MNLDGPRHKTLNRCFIDAPYRIFGNHEVDVYRVNYCDGQKAFLLFKVYLRPGIHIIPVNAVHALVQ